MLMLIAVALQIAAPAEEARASGATGDLIFVPPMPEPLPADQPPATECLMLDQVRSTRIIAGTGIVYRLSGRRHLINRLRGRANALTNGQVMLVRKSSPLLCAGDIVYLADGSGGAGMTFVGLGKFERYEPSIAADPISEAGFSP